MMKDDENEGEESKKEKVNYFPFIILLIDELTKLLTN